ncbi:hypothetical protein Tco_1237093 [Tanacetum coccineum]
MQNFFKRNMLEEFKRNVQFPVKRNISSEICSSVSQAKYVEMCQAKHDTYSVSHAEDDVDNFKRCCTSYTFLVGYRVLIDLILHRSSINNSASLSNKFGGFYFIFKFGISGLLHQVITTIADRIRDKGTSPSKQNSQSSATKVLKQDLIIPSFLDSCFISSTVSEDKRAMLCLDFQICAQDKNFSSICAYTTMMLPRVRNHHGGNVYIRDLVDFDVTMSTSMGNKDTEDPSWSTSFKTRRTRKTSSALEDFICVVFVHDRNISDRLRDKAQVENADFINKLDDNIKKIIKDQVKEQVKAHVSKILPKIEKNVNEQLEAEVLTRSSNKSKTSHAVAANLLNLS